MTETKPSRHEADLLSELLTQSREDNQQRARIADMLRTVPALESECRELANKLVTLTRKIQECEAERDKLTHWKSTNAPRLEAIEGLLADARAGFARGVEALESLASEREANAILTAENEQLHAKVEASADFCWQPIETAPKDGTPVWVYIQLGGGDGEQGVMRWLDIEGASQWVWVDKLLSEADPDPCQPSHWITLPPEPSTE